MEFTGSALSVSAHATWFAQPDQGCVSPSVLADQALRNAKYSISAAAQAGGQISTGQAELTVQMLWGIPSEVGGGGSVAAVTLPPRLLGEVLWDCALPNPPSCHVTGNSLIRTQALPCFAETPATECSSFQHRYSLMPIESSFRHKAEVHENVHTQQFQPGRLLGDLFTIDGPNGLMDFTVPGKGVPLRELTASSPDEMDALIRGTRAAWQQWCRDLADVRRAAAEFEAYAASDSVTPAYLLQSCNLMPF